MSEEAQEFVIGILELQQNILEDEPAPLYWGYLRQRSLQWSPGSGSAHLALARLACLARAQSYQDYLRIQDAWNRLQKAQQLELTRNLLADGIVTKAMMCEYLPQCLENARSNPFVTLSAFLEVLVDLLQAVRAVAEGSCMVVNVDLMDLSSFVLMVQNAYVFQSCLLRAKLRDMTQENWRRINEPPNDTVVAAHGLRGLLRRQEQNDASDQRPGYLAAGPSAVEEVEGPVLAAADVFAEHPLQQLCQVLPVAARPGFAGRSWQQQTPKGCGVVRAPWPRAQLALAVHRRRDGDGTGRVATWNCLKRWEVATAMRQGGLRPDAVTWSVTIGSASSVHWREALEGSVRLASVACSALITACEGSLAWWERSLQLLQLHHHFSLKADGIVPQNGAIRACESGRRWEWALELVKWKAAGAKVEVDEITLTAAIGACGRASAWQAALLLLRTDVAPPSAMTEKGFRIANEVNKEGWEKAQFPILCETCLGDNPYVRMQKEDYGVECKICVRPFTIFRWKAGTQGRYKATVVCQSCAKVKNVCQTCLFDLEYGLPVQVRDKYLEELGANKVSLPHSRVGRDYQLQNAQADKDGEDLPYGKVGAHPMLQRLARMTPYYKRNEARICTFYVKGACNRGADCPFKHELPQGGELANQKLRDRFHGENDPLAAKIMRRAEEDLTLMPPEDKSVTTLYLGGLPAGTKEKETKGSEVCWDLFMHGCLCRKVAEQAAKNLGH
eukprot:g25476.t1